MKTPDHDPKVSDLVDGVPTAKNQDGIKLGDLNDDLQDMDRE